MKPKFILFSILSLFSLLNLVLHLIHPNPLVSYQRQLYSLSAGTRYFARLQLWYTYARLDDWNNAAKLENRLNPLDIAQYKSDNHPLELKKRLNNLVIKPRKTAEDWLELARIQTKLNYLSDSLNSLSRAKQLDPVRDDITLFYSQLF